MYEMGSTAHRIKLRSNKSGWTSLPNQVDLKKDTSCWPWPDRKNVHKTPGRY